MLGMVSYSRRPKSGQIMCYLNRTYHVLLTASVVIVVTVWKSRYHVAKPLKTRRSLMTKSPFKHCVQSRDPTLPLRGCYETELAATRLGAISRVPRGSRPWLITKPPLRG